MNQVTHWLDASQVYGSTSYLANKLRSLKSGELKVDGHPSYAAGNLPICGKEGAKDSALPICSS